MNHERIDEAVLALLHLGVFEEFQFGGSRTWKSFDWGAMGRLHKRGSIDNPVTKSKSVILTESGEQLAEEAFNRLFAADD